MVPSLPLLSCESSVSVKENPDRKEKLYFVYSNGDFFAHLTFERIRISVFTSEYP